MIAMDYRILRHIGLEASALIAPEEILASGNLGLSFRIGRLNIPFATIGLGICMHGVSIVNLGGGMMRMRPTDKVGIRMEYRYWRCGEAGVGSIFVGMSYFF
jgi:hypothetical protein